MNLGLHEERAWYNHLSAALAEAKRTEYSTSEFDRKYGGRDAARVTFPVVEEWAKEGFRADF